MSELLNEIIAFSPYLEKITISNLIAINQGIPVINLTPPGIGKSRTSLELFDMLKIKHERIVGRISAKQLYLTLEANKDGGIIVIDESAMILTDKQSKELLMNALWGTGEIMWETSKEQLRCVFKGNIIFNTNYLKNDVFTEALKDRVIYNELGLTSEQMKEKIVSKQTYIPNKELWDKILEGVYAEQELTDKETLRVYDFLKCITIKSIRDEWRAFKIAKGLKNIFGNIDLLETMFVTRDLSYVLRMDTTKAEKLKLICEVKKVSERQARNILKRYGG